MYGRLLEALILPEFFFDIGLDSNVLNKLRGNGQRDILIWSTSDSYVPSRRAYDFDAESVSKVFLDVGTRSWNKYLPLLREDTQSLFICLEHSQHTFLELDHHLKMNFADVLSRVLILPVAITPDPNVTWGFREVPQQHECNSLGLSDVHACFVEEPKKLVPIISLDQLLWLTFGYCEAVAGKPHTPKTATNLPPIELKLDAQGIDIEVLDNMRGCKALLDSLEAVDMKIGTSPESKVPSRREVMQRMRILGFSPKIELSEIDDNGLQVVRYGCRVSEESHSTGSCLFRRTSETPEALLVDVAFSRPFEMIALGLGHHRYVSTQCAHTLRSFSLACASQSAKMAKDTTWWCLVPWLGEPWSNIFLSLEYIWAIPADASEEAEVDTQEYFALIVSGLRTLLLDPWPAIQDSGSLFVVLTLMVEASCRYNSLACYEFQTNPHWKPACRDLQHCSEIFQQYGDMLLSMATSDDLALTELVRLTRSAQLFSAPQCAPIPWNLELVRANGIFPSTMTLDGNSYMTVLDVDSVPCQVEVSLVVLGADEAYFRRFREAAHHHSVAKNTRLVASTDISLPTEGEDWIFDCAYHGSSFNSSKRLQGETVSYGLLRFSPTAVGANVLIVRCAIPDLVDSKPPRSLTLMKSLRAPISMPEVSLKLALQTAQAKLAKVALCSTMVFDFPAMDRTIPGHAEFWLRYHTEELGIDLIFLYDLDGSFSNMEIVKKLRSEGRLIYDNTSLASIQPISSIYKQHVFNHTTIYFVTTMMQHHCLRQAKRKAEWVVMMPHGWDMLLHSPTRDSFSTLLGRLSKNDIHYIQGVRYGEGNSSTHIDSSSHLNVMQRFPHHINLSHACYLCNGWHIPEERAVLLRPEIAETIFLTDVQPRPDLKFQSGTNFGHKGISERTLDVHEWRANHYVHLFGRPFAYTNEEDIPEIRLYTFWDTVAASLGEKYKAG